MTLKKGIDNVKCDVEVLGKKITEKYLPDIIVAIGIGGFMPGKLLAETLDCDYTEIIISRNINLQKIYEFTPKGLRFLISIYHKTLFIIKDPELLGGITIPLYDRNVLIVDDEVHTGKTINIAKSAVLNLNPRKIRTAAISTLRHNLDLDFSLYTGHFEYPWSKNSLDYNLFHQWLEERNSLKAASQ